MPEPTTSASQLDAIEANDPTKAELQDCANARAEVLAANTNLQTVVTLLTTPKPSTPTTTVKKSSSSSSSSSSSNARAVASAKADLLKANQDLQAANDDLDAATLVAPISGTVGVVGLTKGDSASSGTITIVGSGNAVVTFELPLKTRSLVTVGQEVTVTPAGSTTAMKGKLTAISTLETSGTSGSTTTYATTVAVSDADELLATGAKASVAIAVKSASGVIRLPASAVTPTGTGTATVTGHRVGNGGHDHQRDREDRHRRWRLGGDHRGARSGEAGGAGRSHRRHPDQRHPAPHHDDVHVELLGVRVGVRHSAAEQRGQHPGVRPADGVRHASSRRRPTTTELPKRALAPGIPGARARFGSFGVVGGVREVGHEPARISPRGPRRARSPDARGHPAPRQASSAPRACHRPGRCLPIESRHGGHPQGPERVRTISFAADSRPATGTAGSCAVPTR